MTTMANAFRKALGQPESNHISGDWKEKKDKENRDNAHRLRLEKLDIEQSQGRFGYGEYEITNKHGFKELGFWENNNWFPICSQCGSHTMGNRGQGMLCDSCITQDILECSHDF